MAYNGRQGLYQTGGRFALGDTASDIAAVITAAGNSASKVIGTVNGTPVASTMPSWLLPALLLGGVYLATRSKRNPPRRRGARRRRR